MEAQKPAQKKNEPGACEHCGALVYGDTVRCRQCGKFPIKLHRCTHCRCVSPAKMERCWQCGRMFEPGSDFL